MAAKEALEKLHTEKLEALAAAAEQERARTTAEQEAQLAREMLTQTQMELTVGNTINVDMIMIPNGTI